VVTSVVDKKQPLEVVWTLCRHLKTKCDPSGNAIDDFIETLHFVTVTLVMRGCNGKTNRVLTHMVLRYGPWYCMKTGGCVLTRSLVWTTPVSGSGTSLAGTL
jgi:hypothetical protein